MYMIAVPSTPAQSAPQCRSNGDDRDWLANLYMLSFLSAGMLLVGLILHDFLMINSKAIARLVACLGSYAWHGLDLQCVAIS